jgi:ribosomal protein L12E/L44/L45/RPP1/RPP2
MAGLPEPKVMNTLRNRGKQVDEQTDAALQTTSAPAPAAPKPAGPAITADEAAAKSAKYKAEREAFDKEAKGLPKPGLLNRIFGK